MKKEKSRKKMKKSKRKITKKINARWKKKKKMYGLNKANFQNKILETKIKMRTENLNDVLEGLRRFWRNKEGFATSFLWVR